MTADTELYLVAVGTALIGGLLLYRITMIVKPGYVGLVFLMGHLRIIAHPGFWLVSPVAVVRKVKQGDGPNRALGLEGVAQSDISRANAEGRVLVGDRAFSARGFSDVRQGARVRVIKDIGPGAVWVAQEEPLQ